MTDSEEDRKASPEVQQAPSAGSDLNRGPNPAPASGPHSDRVEELEQELGQLTASYQRLAADFENFRRRKAQEGQDLARYGSAALLQALLPGLDSLTRAVAHIPQEASDGLAEGLRLTVRQIEDALASQGVTRIKAVGDGFDPTRHEAVAATSDPSVPAGTVLGELQAGYLLHDRVVRPAQVNVASGGPEGGGPGAEVLDPDTTSGVDN